MISRIHDRCWLKKARTFSSLHDRVKTCVGACGMNMSSIGYVSESSICRRTLSRLQGCCQTSTGDLDIDNT
jgi:hypothetical protein